ncbi:MAG: MATE family efflux transporter, partial [Eubacteriales bacterium]
VLYNTTTGIFQAVGNSRQPLYFLLISSVINVVLDLVFVLCFKMGVAGTAAATVIAQSISVILAFIKLSRADPVVRLSVRELKIDGCILLEMLKLGLPSGLQNSVIALANMVVQSNINAFDSVAVAGSGAYSRVEGFVFIPITSFALSMTTFVGQNLGAKNYERVKKGARFGIITTAVMAELIGIVIFIFAPVFISCFTNDAESIRYGAMHARTTSLFYILLAMSHALAGIFRGAGRSIVPMAVMLGCWCIFRVSYITIIMRFYSDIRAVYWAYPITWTLSTVIFILIYFKLDWIHTFDRQKT